MLITLTNDFHKTEARLRVAGPGSMVSIRQVRRAKKNLCGVPGCRCSGVLGTRGWQEHKLVLGGQGPDGVPLFVYKGKIVLSLFSRKVIKVNRAKS